MNDQQFVDALVAAFFKLDDRIVHAGLRIPSELLAGRIDGFERWRPIAIRTDAASLTPLYARLPNRFPALYEKLILSYRWCDVDLRLLKLLANPPGATLEPLMQRIYSDPVLTEPLFPRDTFRLRWQANPMIRFVLTQLDKLGGMTILWFDLGTSPSSATIGSATLRN